MVLLVALEMLVVPARVHPLLLAAAAEEAAADL
jgi:hypothetical protein